MARRKHTLPNQQGWKNKEADALKNMRSPDSFKIQVDANAFNHKKPSAPQEEPVVEDETPMENDWFAEQDEPLNDEDDD
tara:strand:+ start:720 stop:956 length:237 start_codon:yes stop_codon:yes gene_type:complete